MRLADEGHGIFTQGVANGDIVLNPRLSLDIQRGSFVDEYIRQGNITLRDGLGLDANTVRINQRLYAPNGRYTVPDIHFPSSGNSIDYSYQLKNATTPQIRAISDNGPPFGAKKTSDTSPKRGASSKMVSAAAESGT